MLALNAVCRLDGAVWPLKQHKFVRSKAQCMHHHAWKLNTVYVFGHCQYCAEEHCSLCESAIRCMTGMIGCEQKVIEWRHNVRSGSRLAIVWRPWLLLSLCLSYKRTNRYNEFYLLLSFGTIQFRRCVNRQCHMHAYAPDPSFSVFAHIRVEAIIIHIDIVFHFCSCGRCSMCFWINLHNASYVFFPFLQHAAIRNGKWNEYNGEKFICCGIFIYGNMFVRADCQDIVEYAVCIVLSVVNGLSRKQYICLATALWKWFLPLC